MYSRTNFSIVNQLLLVEDNRADARLVEILLEEADQCYEVTHCTYLRDACQALTKQDFDAVLLDLNLPDSKGIETLHTILKQRANANVIVLTGFASKEVGYQAVKTGAQDFLVKGELNADQLSQTLRYSIERSSILSRLEEAQRIAHIGNWEYLYQEGVFLASDEIYRILGYTPQELVLTRELMLQHLYKDDLPIAKGLFDNARQHQVAQLDLRVFTVQQELRHLSVLVKTAKQDNGYKYSGVIQDITARKEAEIALEKKQQQYEAIFSQSRDAIYISTIAGELLNVNEAACRLFGFQSGELLHRNIGDFFHNFEDYQTFAAEINKTSFVKDFEATLQRADGGIRTCLITASILDTGDFEGINASIRDITGRKQSDELRKAKELAERSAAMKEQFIASVSHEMRTPMNAILGMSNLIQKNNLDDEQQSYVTAIIQSSQHLLGIINDILEISAIEKEGKVEFKSEKIDLHALLKNLINTYHYKTKEKNIKLYLDLHHNVEQYVIGDTLRLNQILTNLLSNAIKFTEEGHVKLEVSKLGDEGERTRLQFVVEDSGIGIPEDRLRDIFEAFVRIRSNEQKFYPGTGLGLPIAKQLVEMQQGNIEVVSTLGVGSTFTVTLPLLKATAFDQAHTKSTEDPMIPLLYTGDIRILLVEDHKLNQVVAKRTIEREWQQATIQIANNGQEALDYLTQQDFDVVLMDIQMPVMDGIEATRRIRDTFPPDKASIPILAMTAHAHMSQGEKYKEYGMDNCVLKPFQPRDLFNKIAYYLNLKQPPVMNFADDSQNFTPTFIDLSYMDLMTDGDSDMKKMMIELLFDEPVNEIARMEGLERAKNWTELRNVAHKMKSTLAFVGNEKLSETNRRIEAISKEAVRIEKLSETNRRIEAISKENVGTDVLPELIRTLSKGYQVALVELKKVHAQL